MVHVLAVSYAELSLSVIANLPNCTVRGALQGVHSLAEHSGEPEDSPRRDHEYPWTSQVFCGAMIGAYLTWGQCPPESHHQWSGTTTSALPAVHPLPIR
jgi:hypothetical protein